MTFGETDPSEIYGGASAPAAPAHQVTFDRRELNRILSLYGRMVAAGEWRDYAIDFLKDRAVFSVFRRSSEVPIYRIEKNPKLRIAPVDSVEIMFLAMQPKPPFDKKEVRQAVCHAINRDQIIATLLEGCASHLDGPIGPGQYGYDH